MRSTAVARGRALLRLAVVAAALAWASAVPAVEPDEILSDTQLEARARHLSGELRCLVCQNQSIDDSNAPLARDLRLLVRERLKAGDSDAQVRGFVVSRYGEFVLLKPTFAWHTLVLWLTPIAVLIGAVLFVWRASKTARETGESAGATALNAEEEAKLYRVLAASKPPPNEGTSRGGGS